MGQPRCRLDGRGGKVNGILDGRKTTKEEVGLRMTNLVKEEQA